MLDISPEPIIIRLLTRWCWNWQTGMVEGHVPLGRAGSTPAQRTAINSNKAAVCGFVRLSLLLDFQSLFDVSHPYGKRNRQRQVQENDHVEGFENTKGAGPALSSELGQLIDSQHGQES